MKTKQFFVSIITTTLLLQSFLPLVTAQSLPTGLRIDAASSITTVSPRQARISITDDYSRLISEQNLRASNILELGAKLYIYNTTLPLCQTYQAVVPREINKANMHDQAVEFNQTNNTAISSISSNLQLNQTRTICKELIELYTKKISINEVSSDVEDLRRGFFESFVPTKDYDQFVQDMGTLSDAEAREQYIADNVSLEELNAIQQYISTGERTYTDRCELSSQDRQSYDSAARAYSLAKDTQNTQAQALALRTMQGLQKNAVCPNQTQAPVIVSSECTQQLNITQAQIEILSRDSTKNAAQITKLQQTRDAIRQEEKCLSLDVASLPSLPNNFQFGNQNMRIEVVGAQGQQEALPNKTAAICTTTARTLNEQLTTAPLGTLNLLIDRLESYSFDPDKKPLVSLVQTLATKNLNDKRQALGIGNDKQAFENLLRNVVHIANNVFENRAINNVIDLLPDIESYIDQLDQTSLGTIESIDEFSDVVRDGRRFEWNATMNGFDEGVAQQAGVRVAIPAKKENEVNNMVLKLNEVSALKYTNTIQMYPYSAIGSFPTLNELQGYLFGQSAPNYDYYNRVWMEVLAADTEQLSNELYQILQGNKSQYPLFNQANVGVEVWDILGHFITTITNYETNELIIMPAGLYRTQSQQFLEVGENGETNIYHQDETVLPQAIGITQHINNNLVMGFNGNIVRPELVIEYARLEETKTTYIIYRDFMPEIDDQRVSFQSAINDVNPTHNVNYNSVGYTDKREVVATKRKQALPLSVEGEFFADPHTFTLTATRTVNEDGTNTIDATFQIRGGTLCDPLVIQLSTIYYADEYGMPPTEQESNPFISADVTITFNRYEASFSVNDMQTFVSQIQEAIDNEGDLVSIVNNAVVNNLKLFDTPFGTLEANEDGVIIRYADTEYGVDDVIPLFMDIVLDKINYGWLERIMGVLDFGEDTQEESEDIGVFNWSYDRGQPMEKEEKFVLTVTQTFNDGSEQYLNVDNPVLYISKQSESPVEYPLSFRPDGQYSALVPTSVRDAIEKATHDVWIELFSQEQRTLSIQSEQVQEAPLFSIAQQSWVGDYTFVISYVDQDGNVLQLGDAPLFHTENYDAGTDSWSYTQVFMDRDQENQRYVYDISDTTETQSIIDQAVQIYVQASYEGEEQIGYYKMQK